MILPIAIYGAETLGTTLAEMNFLKFFEMKCLRAILGITRSDRARNEDVRAILEVNDTIEGILNAGRLRRFGHVVRSPETNLINASIKPDFQGSIRRGRPLRIASRNLSKSI